MGAGPRLGKAGGTLLKTDWDWIVLIRGGGAHRVGWELTGRPRKERADWVMRKETDRS